MSPKLLIVLSAMLVLCGLSPGLAGAGQSAKPMAYEITIEGELQDSTRRMLTDASLTQQLQARGVTGLAGLRRRIDGDKIRFNKVLRSQGFYRGRVDGRVDAVQSPVRVVLTVATGAVFLIEDYAIQQAPGDGQAARIPDPADIGIEMGMAADAARLNAAKDALLDKLRASGHPNPEISGARYTVDHDRTTVSAVITVAPGPAAMFGPGPRLKCSGQSHSPADGISDRNLFRFMALEPELNDDVLSDSDSGPH